MHLRCVRCDGRVSQGFLQSGVSERPCDEDIPTLEEEKEAEAKLQDSFRVEKSRPADSSAGSPAGDSAAENQ